MRILFAISVVAFVALLWASLSAAQYIRKARRRRPAAGQPETAAAEVVPPLPAEISGLDVVQTEKGEPIANVADSGHTPDAADTPVSPPAIQPEWGYLPHDAGDLSDPAAHRHPRLRRQS